jgi:RHS repeat-associated protein
VIYGAPGVPLYIVRADGSTLTLARDGLGSIRAESNAGGAVTGAFRYAAYGGSDSVSIGTPTLLGFAGEYRDSATLIYLRARWYDTSTGRFLTKDPVPGNPTWPASLNPYAYAAGNPILLTDPTGTCVPFCIVLAIVVVKVGLSIFDAISTAQTLQDPEASDFEKGAMLGLFAVGLASQGGEATAGRLGIKAAKAALKAAASKGERTVGRAGVDAALDAGERWLGVGYSEIDKGVFRSADGLRQFRITTSDWLKGPHVHFESIADNGRTIVENARLDLIR